MKPSIQKSGSSQKSNTTDSLQKGKNTSPVVKIKMEKKYNLLIKEKIPKDVLGKTSSGQLFWHHN